MRKLIGELERIPKFYGVAWRDFDYCGAVCYPVPINIIARWLRSLWFSLSRLSYARKQSWREQREAEMYLRISERERNRAQARIFPLAERVAEKMFEERFHAEWNRRIGAVLAVRDGGGGGNE